MKMLLEFTYAMAGEIDSNAPISLKNIKTFLTMLKKTYCSAPTIWPKPDGFSAKTNAPLQA